MEIKGKKVLVLGGYGEVGFAICHELLCEGPKELIITSLRQKDALATVEKLRSETPDGSLLIPEYGNLFTRWSLKDITREEIRSNSQYQQWIAEDALEEFDEKILTSSTLYKIVIDHCPEIIVDCINTATALAYQNVYQSYKEISEDLRRSEDVKGLTNGIYQLLSTLYIPPLIRHIQILYEAMKRGKTHLYLKIGTTGTGGMGLNIPFTHGEEHPSRLLLSKAAVAGAQTLLLYLLSRTPGGPIVKELKPAALIGWKGIGKGEIFRGGHPMPLYDCPPMEGHQLTCGNAFYCGDVDRGLQMEGRSLEGVYVDTGENGLFSEYEFKVVTALCSMEYITPEEIAKTVLLEIRGVNTSKDVLGAIAGAVMGATYRAGVLRQRVIKEMACLGQQGIAYGLLGPRVAKMIFEAHLLKRCYGTLEKAIKPLPLAVSRSLEEGVRRDQEIRCTAVSQGIPILLADGETLLFASRHHRDKSWEEETLTITPESIEKWASREWIDLRPKNMSRWQEYFRKILRESEESLEDNSSRFDCGSRFWFRNNEGKIIIDPGEIVGWILIKEGGGRDHRHSN